MARIYPGRKEAYIIALGTPIAAFACGIGAIITAYQGLYKAAALFFAIGWLIYLIDHLRTMFTGFTYFLIHDLQKNGLITDEETINSACEYADWEDRYHGTGSSGDRPERKDQGHRN